MIRTSVEMRIPRIIQPHFLITVSRDSDLVTVLIDAVVIEKYVMSPTRR